jgi:hypothetical protein
MDTYIAHAYQIPDPQLDYYQELDNTPESGCETACDGNVTCLGFTMATAGGSDCWLYSSAPKLKNFASASWFQKPGTKPIPAPPPPPPPPTPPPVPPQLACPRWNSTTQWKAIECDATAGKCLLVVDVTNGATGERASHNVLPFVPPVRMTLPVAKVTATVGATASDGTVPISVCSTATALYVVLTTLANGRFSDNAFLLMPLAASGEQAAVVPGGCQVIHFLPWGAAGADPNATLKLLKASLRVEHLADNL